MTNADQLEKQFRSIMGEPEGIRVSALVRGELRYGVTITVGNVYRAAQIVAARLFFQPEGKVEVSTTHYRFFVRLAEGHFFISC